MKALTIKQPWATLIFAADDPKTVENRTWKPPSTVIGQRIAIHAGRTADGDFDADLLTPEEHLEARRMRGVILGTAVVAGVLAPGDAADGADGEWWAGDCYGWVLRDPIKFARPIPARGKLSLWTWDGEEGRGAV